MDLTRLKSRHQQDPVPFWGLWGGSVSWLTRVVGQVQFLAAVGPMLCWPSAVGHCQLPEASVFLGSRLFLHRQSHQWRLGILLPSNIRLFPHCGISL